MKPRSTSTFIEAACRYAGITPFPLDPSTFLTGLDRPLIDPDPMLAAIAAHRRAWADLGANMGQLDARSDQDPAATQRLDQLHEAVNEAECQLIDVAPTTMAGVFALTSYASTYLAPENPNLVAESMSNLAEALPKIAA